MRNLADAIESFILGELLRDREDTLLVQRNELAEKLSCAPSQISYVLSTRFTPERGYLVESRRGSGGFVRIVRVVPHQVQFCPKEPSAVDLLQHWAGQRLITSREQKLLQFMLQLVDGQLDEEKKKRLLQQAITKMTDNGQE